MVKFGYVPTEEAILNLLCGKQVGIVSGAYFGDEAKGKTVHSLSLHPNVTVIARVNSGENAGHTVKHNGEKFVFHLMPSGIVAGKKTVIGTNCVMDPFTFYGFPEDERNPGEILPLINAGISLDNLTIGNVSIVAPWHKIADALRDPNASTLKGMSQIHSDIARKRDFTLEHLINDRHSFAEKSYNTWMSEIWAGMDDIKMSEMIDNSSIPQHVRDFLESDYDRDQYLESLYGHSDIMGFLRGHFGDPVKVMVDELERGNIVLLEGPQSYYLSNKVRNHHSTSTSASTHSTGIYADSNLPPKYTNHTLTINVAKGPAGASRVGLGANPSGYVPQDWFSSRGLKREDLPEIYFESAYAQFLGTIDRETGLQSEEIPKYRTQEGNSVEIKEELLNVNEALQIAEAQRYEEFGSTTGKPRILSPLDLPHLAELKRNQQGRVSISCMDRVNGLDEILMVTGYVYKGDRYQDETGVYNHGDRIMAEDIRNKKISLPCEGVLEKCDPIYEVLPGWDDVTTLDTNVQNYLNRVEELTGVKVISIGHGPDTDEIMYLERGPDLYFSKAAEQVLTTNGSLNS